MPIECGQIPKCSEGDTDTMSVDYTDVLDSGETLTGTPTIVEVTTTDLTISNKAVSTGALTILDRTVSTGMAVQCKITGMQNNSDNTPKLYRIRITVSTTGNRTFVRDVTFQAF